MHTWIEQFKVKQFAREQMSVDLTPPFMGRLTYTLREQLQELMHMPDRVF